MLGLAIALAAMATSSDLSFPGRAVRFTGAALVAGFLFWLAAARFDGSRRVLWIGAIFFRVVMLFAEPSDDSSRYVWEGRVQIAGFNPYVDGPLSPSLEPLRNAAWEMVNHKEFAAAYPPGAQLFFRGLAAAGVASLLAWKILFALADLAVVGLVVAWAGASRAVWYAWNPLPIFTFAGAAHFDVLMVLPLVGAAWLLDRGLRANSARLLALSSLLLGLSIAIKLAPIILVPVWFFALGWRRVALLTPALLPLPLLALLYGWPDVDIFASAREFGRVARTNDAVWWLSERFVWPNIAQKNDAYQLIAAGACVLLAAAFRHDWKRGALWVLGAVLLLSPALHPWYLTWILPFAAAGGARARAWVVLSVSIFLYFLLWTQPLPWREPIWLRLAIFLPPLLYGMATLVTDSSGPPRTNGVSDSGDHDP